MQTLSTSDAVHRADDAVRGQNIYQMACDVQAGGADWWARAPLYVQRHSWSTGFAEVLYIEPAPSDWDASKAPYFNNPLVVMLVKYRQTAPYMIEELTGAGTLAYTRLRQLPAWWRGGINHPVKGLVRGREAILATDGFRIEP